MILPSWTLWISGLLLGVGTRLLHTRIHLLARYVNVFMLACCARAAVSVSLSLFTCAQGLAFLSERVQSVKLEGGAAASAQLPGVPAPTETVVTTDTKPKE